MIQNKIKINRLFILNSINFKRNILNYLINKIKSNNNYNSQMYNSLNCHKNIKVNNLLMMH